MNALDAIAWCLRAQKDPETWREKLEAVVDYHEDDCTATKFIKDWLASRVVETGGASMGAQSYSLCHEREDVLDKEITGRDSHREDGFTKYPA